jgi:hypothetical protein
LSDLEIVGAARNATDFLAGEGFSRHVVFAGCSPYLVMQPPGDGSRRFCHVAVHGPFPRPRLVTGPNTVKPRCRACRARFSDWRERLDDWVRVNDEANCTACGQLSSVHELDWRDHAISGRLLVELRNVFPGEASPSDLLMHSLQTQTGQDWLYAWAAYLDVSTSEA